MKGKLHLDLARRGVAAGLVAALAVGGIAPWAAQEAFAATDASGSEVATLAEKSGSAAKTDKTDKTDTADKPDKSQGSQTAAKPERSEKDQKLIDVVLKLKKDKVTDAAAIEEALDDVEVTKKEFLKIEAEDFAQGDAELQAAIEWVQDQLEAADAEQATKDPTGSDSASKKDDSAKGSTAASSKSANKQKSSDAAAKKDSKKNNYPKWSYKGDNSYTPRRVSADTSTDRFIAMIGEPAREIAGEYDVYASVLIAHAALQSDAGKSELAGEGYHNLFAAESELGSVYGLGSKQAGHAYSSATRKSYDSEDVMAERRAAAGFANLKSLLDGVASIKANDEDADDAIARRGYGVRDGYRVYDSYEDSLRDYAEMQSQGLLGLRKPITRANLVSYRAACARIERDLGIEGYADQMIELIDDYDLTRFDEPAEQVWAKTYSVQVSRDEARERGLLAEDDKGSDRDTFTDERTAADLVNEATKHLGEKYVWGGTTPGSFDCSGFVGYVYQHALGVSLPRTTHYQCLLGKDVDFSDLRCGDLMFFVDDEDVVDHVGMYLGAGCYIEASGSAGKVVITPLEDKKPNFAKRVL